MSKKELPIYYFELYKLTVEMADRISARRTAANAFFIALHGSLISLLSFAIKRDQSIELVLIIFCLVGIIFSWTWRVLIKSYRDLNSAKFKVINEMEKEFSVAPFSEEWKYLKNDPIKRWRKRYAELTSIEKRIPLLFILMYLVIIIVTIN